MICGHIKITQIFPLETTEEEMIQVASQTMLDEMGKPELFPLSERELSKLDLELLLMTMRSLCSAIGKKLSLVITLFCLFSGVLGYCSDDRDTGLSQCFSPLYEPINTTWFIFSGKPYLAGKTMTVLDETCSGSALCTSADCKPLGNKSCLGSLCYCSKYGCSSSEDFCGIGLAEKTYFYIGDTPVIPTRIFSAFISEEAVPTANRVSSVTCSPSIALENSAVKITSNCDMSSCLVWIFKKDKSLCLNASGFSYAWQLSESWSSFSGRMHCKVNCYDEAVHSSIWSYSEFPCSLRTDVSWSSLRHNFSCNSFIWKIMFVGCWLFFIVLSLELIYFAFLGLKPIIKTMILGLFFLGWCLCYVPVSLWRSNLMNRLKKSIEKVKIKTVHELSPVVLVMLFTCAIACDVALISDATFSDCTVNGNIESCSVKFSTSITIPKVSNSVCLSFVKDNNQFFNMTITYDALISWYTLNQMFVTSDWTGLTDASVNCPMTTDCFSIHHKCGSQATADPTQSGHLKGTSTNWPGVSGCYETAKNPLCFFALKPTCTWWRYARKPFSPAAAVFGLGANSLEAKATLVLQSTENLTKTSVSLSNNQINVGVFKMYIVGTLSSPSATTTDNLIVYSGHSYLAPTAKTNIPDDKAVGDIQASTEAGLLGGGVNSFASTVLQPQVSYGSISVIWPETGISRKSSWIQLPANVNGNYVVHTSNSLSFVVGNPGALVLAIESPVMSLSRKVSVVCPVCEFIDLTGCYSCALGSVIRLKCRSKCSEGSVTLTSSIGSLTTQSMRLTTTTSVHNVTSQFGSASVNGELTVTGSGSTQKITFSGTLTLPDLIDEDKNVTASTNSTKGVTWLTKFYLGSLRNWYWYLAGILLILAIVAIIVIMVLYGPQIASFLMIPVKFIKGWRKVTNLKQN